MEKWFAEIGQGDFDPLTKAEMKVFKDKNRERLLAYAADKRTDSARPGGRSMGMRPIVYAMAATFLLLVAASILLWPEKPVVVDPSVANETIITNSSGQVREVAMKDGSVVYLEPGSRLTYSDGFGDSLRMVALDGEAFFQVAKDSLRPFIVETNEVLTKVLGTSFTVSAFSASSKIMVEVKTGKVSVIARGASGHKGKEIPETILTPNQKVVYHKASQTVRRQLVEEPQPVVAEEEVKSMHFERAPVSRVFEGLEKVYGVAIEFDEEAFSSCILTTSIAEGSIRSRLNVICEAINAEYAFVEDKIVITGAGCGGN